MDWEITCYNGTVWNAPFQMSLNEALTRFYNETNLCDLDIKSIINNH